MLKRTGIVILVTMFLISGMATIGNVYTISVEKVDIEYEDQKESDTDTLGLDSSVKDGGQLPHSTRAVNTDLYNLYWEEMTNDRVYFGSRSIQCADLNHDGLIDIVDGSYMGIYVSLQNIDGTWSSMNDGLPPQAGGNPDIYGLDIDDINNDGWKDFISINYSNFQQTPDIYLNNMGINWLHQTGLGFDGVLNSRSIVCEDFNKDGILDIAYLGDGPDVLLVYLQSPIGTWTKKYEDTTLSLAFPNCINSCDYDNDGDMDIIVGGSTQRLYVVENVDGSGTNWNTQLVLIPSSTSYTVSVACSDLNHDAYADIVCGVYVSSARNIIVMSFNGTSWDEKLGNLPYFGEYVDFSINDINFDGNQDIVASGGGGADVFLGHGDFNWTLLSKGLSSGSYANYIADIDNDGMLDVVDTDGIYETKGLENLFVKDYEIISNNLPLGEKFALDYGDLNKDGLLDLLAIRESSVIYNSMVVYFNNGDGTWNFYSVPQVSIGNMKDGKIGDMDNDGDLDIVFCSERWSQNILIVRNAGDGTFPDAPENIYSLPIYPVTPPNTAGRAYTLDLGDYDLDGDLDILATAKNDSSIPPPSPYEIWLIRNDGGVWTNETLYHSPDWIFDAKFAYINHDPYLDIVTVGYSGYGTKAFLWDKGSNSWIETGNLPSTPTYRGIDFGDIDNDGILEILAGMHIYSYDNSTQSWILIKNFVENTQDNAFIDLNFDGLIDIVQLHPSWLGGFTVWTNKGNNTWQKGVYQNPDEDYFQEFTAFDYDLDGTKELFFSSEDIGIRVYEVIIEQDKTEVEFSNPQPGGDEWLYKLTISLSVTISDIEGSGVDGNNIEYATSTSGIGGFGSWNAYTPIPQDAQEITASIPNILFAEGDQNYVKWRAKDVVGNGYTESEPYQILIDVSDPYFQNENPKTNSWVNSQSQTLSVEITDVWSGLNAPSIKYKLDTGTGYGEWVSAGEITDGNVLVPSTMAFLHEGVNKIIWTATDKVGHKVTSEEYIIKLDTKPTTFKSPEPEEGQWMTQNSIKCSVNIFDSGINGSGVNSSNIQYRYSTNGIFEYGPWIDATDLYDVEDGQQIGVHVNTTQITFQEGTNNYVQFQALDLATNGYTPSPDYRILVDTTSITFTTPLPGSDDWQSSSEVICYITIEDMDGSGVDGTSTEYWVVKNDPNPGSVKPNWTKAITQINAESITFSAIVELPDGIYNWIKWRAKDVAGNGYTESNWNQIKVDSTGIQFSNPDPTMDDWQTSTQVNSSIILTIDTDPEHLDYSNPQSLQYRYSNSGVLGFGPWNDVVSYSIIDPTTLVCKASLPLSDGTENYVQWRALENVSKGVHTASTPYQIKVDSTPLTYTNPIPTSNTVNELLEVTCYITLQDSGSGVDGSSIRFRYSVNGTDDNSFTAWNSTVSQPNSQLTTISIGITLENGDDNYLQWSAKDVAGNGPIYSQKYQIKVNFIDSDGDGTSDDDDYDDDNDGWLDSQDKFPLDPNEWQDTDNDGIGDNADDDDDNDGVLDVNDKFPTNPAEYLDSDGDGIGDNSDSDDDNDGVPDLQDKFPYNSTEWSDTDNDGIGDNIDSDIDGDGYANDNDAFPTNPNEWEDFDIDGIGDNTDTDDDNDGVPDLQDKFPFDPAEWSDSDDDGLGNNADSDDDNDGRIDDEDDFPYNPNEWKDSDGDGIGDNTDSDRDGDGFPNTNDAFSEDPTEWHDTDEDGIGNNLDMDDDNDGYNDTIDQFPLDKKEWLDFDSDGIGDNSDSDKDGDGYPNTNDAFPDDPNEWLDPDSDEVGNNMDDDDDGDGYNDTKDQFPTNSNEWQDTDRDGIGDNADPDDDNDGALDYDDFAPLDSSIQSDPNLIRIGGVEFELGELIMGIMMAVAAVILGTIVFTRKKRLYYKYKNLIDECPTVLELNVIEKEIKFFMEKERLTHIQLTMLKEQLDGKYLELRQKELEERLGKLPSKVEETIRDVISDKIITEDEFVGMQRWLSRLRESKDFDSDKKAKLQEVLKEWIDDNIA